MFLSNQMKRVCRLAVVFPLLGLGLTICYGEPVAVDNGDFEKGMDNWEGKGAIAADVKHGGEKSMLLERGYVYQPPGKGRLCWIQPGFDYRVSVWIKSDGCEEQGVSITAVRLGGPGERDSKWIGGWLEGANPHFIHDNGASPALLATGGTHYWKKFEADIPASQLNAETRALFIYLRHDAQPEPKGKAYFDDLTVERLPKGTAKVVPEVKGVKNGGFEDGKRAWGGPGMNKPGGIVAEAPVEGKFCLKLTGGYVLQERVPVEGRKHYRVSTKVKSANAPEGSVFVQFSYRGPGVSPAWNGPVRVSYANRTEPAVFVTGGSFRWKEFTAVVATPNKADHLLIYLRKIDGTEGAAYYDDVKVEPTDEPVTSPQELRRAGMAPPVPTTDDTDFATASLENTGFEQGDKNWVRRGATEVVSDDATEGKASLKIITGSALQGSKVQEKNNYKVSVAVKTDAMAESAASVRLQFRGPKPIYKLEWSTPIVTGATHGWKNLSGVVQVPPGATDMLVHLHKDVDDGVAWFDDLKVEPTDEPAPTAEEKQNAKLARLLPAAPSGQDTNAVIQAALELGQQASPESLTLADNGRAAYRVYVGSTNSAIEFHAAEELAKHLGQISGASFEPFAHDANPATGPLLVIGRNNALTAKLCPDIPYDKLGDDGFVIRTVGPHVVIAGNTPRGTLYGVYWLLDRHLGVRWFSPSYTFVPSEKKLALKKPTELQVPRFIHREIFARDGDDEPFRAHNLLNGKSHHRIARHSPPGLNSWSKQWPDSGHNFHKVVSTKELHAGGQLAMMSEDVRRIAAEHFSERAEKGKPSENAEYFGLSQEDRGWAPDPASQAFANSHGGNLSAPNIDMVLDVANRVRRKNPEAKFSTLAYQWSFSPPTGMVIPDYVMTVLAPIHADFSQPYSGPKNRAIAENIKGWTRISKNLYVWDYITNFGAYVLPYPNLDGMFASIQWLAGFPSIKGYFAQGSMASIGAEFACLRQWVGARLLWNPSQDRRKLVAEFVKGYYGDAAPYISEHIKLIHESAENTGAKLLLKTPVTSPFLSFEVMRKADELFVTAEQAVGDKTGFLRRVKTARIGVDVAILLRRGDYAVDAKKAAVPWNPDTQSRLKRVDDYAAAAGITAYGEGMAPIKSMLPTMALERTAAPPLDIVKGLKDADWMEIRDLDLKMAIGSAKIVPDALASDGGAATMPGKSPHWGIQLQLDCLPPEGQWKLYASVRVDPGDGADDANAMTFGVYPPAGNYRTVKLKEVADGKYHTFELPGAYINDAGSGLWFAPPNSNAIKVMYVDRVVAVRVAPQ